MGHNVVVNTANEPSDIIWENLQYGYSYMNRQQIKVGIIITIFIFLTFMLFSVLKATAGKNSLKYPNTVDCFTLSGDLAKN